MGRVRSNFDIQLNTKSLQNLNEALDLKLTYKPKLNLSNTMKKFIYSALLAIASVCFFTSCTEEEVMPKQELKNGGGSGYLDMDKV